MIRRTLFTLLFIFTLLFSNLFAQKNNEKQKIKVSVTNEGFVKDAPGHILTENSEVEIETSSLERELTPKEKDAIKTKILKIVQIALDNIKDDSLHLMEYYKEIWKNDPNFYNKYKAELTCLHDWLLNGTSSNSCTYHYVPHPDTLEKKLNEKIKLTSYVKKNISNGEINIRLITTDFLKHLILNRYVKDASGVETVMDISYRNGWRQLESYYRETGELIEEFSRLKNEFIDCNCDPYNRRFSHVKEFVNNVEKGIKQNSIVNMLGRGDPNFYKKWLWFTGSLPYINPLLATEEDRLYPVSEPNFALNEVQKKLIDSLQKSTYLKTFQEDSFIHNSIRYPFKKSSTEKSGFVTLNYFYDPDSLNYPVKSPEFLAGENQVSFLIHNVPENATIQFTEQEKDLQDESRASKEFSESLTGIGTLITGLSGIGTVWGKFSPLLNPPSEKMIPTRFPFNTTTATASLRELNKMNTKSLTGGDDKRYTDNSNWIIGIQTRFMNKMTIHDSTELAETLKEKEELFYAEFIIINGRKVPYVKKDNVDKKSFLIASLLPGSCDYKCKESCEKNLEFINSFVSIDNCCLIDYSTQSTVAESYKSLLSRYIPYQERITKCREEIEASLVSLNKNLSSLKPFISIVYRSLPPVKLEHKTAETIRFQTVVKKANLPDAPRTYKYKLTRQNTSKPVNDSIIAESSIKVVKKHHFLLSAGLAYTLKKFYINEAPSGSGLPVAKTGDRFWPVAGLHYYPVGIIRNKDKLPGNFGERSSLFVGLSLLKALENYYIGYSYDFIPGFKLILGGHFYKHTKYNIVANQVADKISGVKGAGVFVSFNIDTDAFLKIIGIIK